MHPGPKAARDETTLTLVRYFEQCYRADNREQALLDIFSRRVEFHQFLNGTEDLLCGDYPQIPVSNNPEGVAEVGQVARYQRTEKALWLTALLIVGRMTDAEGGKSRLCAPLFFFPAQVDSDEYAPMLRVDLEQQRVNYPLLQLLATRHDLDAQQLQTLAEDLPAAPWHLGHLGRIAERLETSFPDLDTEALRLFPRQAAEDDVRRWYLARKEGLRAVVATPLVLVPRSPDTRGVLTELHRLHAGPTPEPLSPPLQVLLRTSPAATSPGATKEDSLGEPAQEHVPALLSAAQRQVLVQSVRAPLSIVIGPPGTGKSFTIAAIALEAVYRGESVLVAGQRDHAVDVVADKLEALGGPHELIIRTGRREYRRELRQTLERLQRGTLPYPSISSQQRQAKEAERQDLRLRLSRLETKLTQRSQLEQRWGRWHSELSSAPWWRRLPLSLAAGTLDTVLSGALGTPYWQLAESYQQLTDHYLSLTLELLRDAFVQRIERHRPLVAQLHKALRATVESQRQERFDDLDVQKLFQVFPIWMCRLANLNLTLPMRSGMVDLLILDEATQCDIASCLPAFQRARRVVVVGDPEQLRHLSFLSRHRQQGIARELNLSPEIADRFDYARLSILDLVEDQLEGHASVFLDEHFRSTPEIIAFSNRHIYGGALKVMRERPPLPASGSEVVRTAPPPLELCRVQGQRLDNGENPGEADALLEYLLDLVRPGSQGPAQTEPFPSIGILSPFRAQVDHLSERLSRTLMPNEQARHKLLVGTPYAFQGEERDIMLLSLAVDDDAHAGSFRFLARRDVLNVAVTRARNRQIVFTSLSDRGRARLPELLRDYLRFLEADDLGLHTVDSAPLPDAFHDDFALHLSDELRQRGWQVWQAYPIAGFTVDLVIHRAGTTLGLDLIGHPGRFADSFEIERSRIFRRAGLQILPIPYSAWVRDPRSCLDAIEGVR